MEIVRMFWTGGWDSTYRLLYLVLVKKQPVQPYYIIDPDRASFPTEIRAMVRIKEMIFERCPEARMLIRPTIMTVHASEAGSRSGARPGMARGPGPGPPDRNRTAAKTRTAGIAFFLDILPPQGRPIRPARLNS